MSLKKLFQYPLGLIRLSIATANGGMVKTSKAQLMHHLEANDAVCAPPQIVDCVYIIDGNAIIQSCVSLPDTFGELALQIISRLP